jgi:hypothetical protein
MLGVVVDEQARAELALDLDELVCEESQVSAAMWRRAGNLPGGGPEFESPTPSDGH